VSFVLLSSRFACVSEEAHAYPTNFIAMLEEWIECLSLRGEQLTLCLARAYMPHLINGQPRAQGTCHAH